MKNKGLRYIFTITSNGRWTLLQINPLFFPGDCETSLKLTGFILIHCHIYLIMVRVLLKKKPKGIWFSFWIQIKMRCCHVRLVTQNFCIFFIFLHVKHLFSRRSHACIGTGSSWEPRSTSTKLIHATVKRIHSLSAAVKCITLTFYNCVGNMQIFF